MTLNIDYIHYGWNLNYSLLRVLEFRTPTFMASDKEGELIFIEKKSEILSKGMKDKILFAKSL